jgi:acyl-CoA dehydrogenase
VGSCHTAKRRCVRRVKVASPREEAATDFKPSPKTEELQQLLLEFMDEHIYPAEPVFREQLRESGDPFFRPPIWDELKVEARKLGLWNLFLPDERYGAGLTNLEYAPLAEITGRSPLAPEALNCAAPDTGNMEILAMFGTPDQKRDWLEPLLEGEIRSCFAMTEPDVASSDATNMEARIERDGDEYVINGRKWWTSGAASERCKISIVMGVTDPEADPYHQHSMILVPLDTDGVNIVRALPVFGYDDGAHGGHCEVIFDDVRVPATNMLGEEGAGFTIAQSRLGPGRIHHCMRAIGMAERAFDLMCERAHGRSPFGKPLARQGVVQNWIAESRIEIEQARLLVLKTAWLMDTAGNKGARIEVSAIKVSAPEVACRVIDRAIQVHGGGGVSDDFPLAAMYAHARTLRIADGPDEVHKMSIARRELHRYQPQEQAVPS